MIPLHIDDPPYIPCPCCRAQSTYFFSYPTNEWSLGAYCESHKNVLENYSRFPITKAEYLALQLEAKL